MVKPLFVTNDRSGWFRLDGGSFLLCFLQQLILDAQPIVDMGPDVPIWIMEFQVGIVDSCHHRLVDLYITPQINPSLTNVFLVSLVVELPGLNQIQHTLDCFWISQEHMSHEPIFCKPY
uniref:Uncharacterized protein n=1 Tax=Cacopsylla melanoneura TaxID=428564 RepID=A0A8D8Q958_9HEMI